MAYIFADWHVPSMAASTTYQGNRGGPYDVANWAGLDTGDFHLGTKTTEILQAGSDAWDGLFIPGHTLWWEDWPNPPTYLSNWTVSAGDWVGASVECVDTEYGYYLSVCGGTDLISFFIADYTTNTWTSFLYQTYGVVKVAQAEVITEEHPYFNLSLPYENRFGSVLYTSTYAEALSNGNTIGDILSGFYTLQKVMINPYDHQFIVLPSAENTPGSGQFSTIATGSE